jgi:hypothetical protein
MAIERRLLRSLLALGENAFDKTFEIGGEIGPAKTPRYVKHFDAQRSSITVPVHNNAWGDFFRVRDRAILEVTVSGVRL